MRIKYSNLALIISFFICATFLSLQAGEPDATWFKDVTFESGLTGVHSSRIWIADIDGDNYPDLAFGEGNATKNHLYIYKNVPNPDQTSSIKRIFVDWTDSSGINKNRDPQKTTRIIDVATFVDVNNDGSPDLVTSTYYHRLDQYIKSTDPGDRSEVYLNDGKGHFTLLENAGLYELGLLNTTGFGFLDNDLDGNIDLFMGQWFYDYSSNNGDDVGKWASFFMKGNGDGTFTRVLDNGATKNIQPLYGTNVTDWNNDGWQDIITSAYCRSGGSLYKNLGNGTFTDAATAASYSSQKIGGDHGQALCQWEANPADFNNDGFMDLLQVEVHGGMADTEGRTHISVNQGSTKYYKYEWQLGLLKRDESIESHLGDQGGTWVDIDGDGWLDVCIGQMAYPAANTEGQERLYVLKQNANHSFDDVSKKLGIFDQKEAHSIEPADYDLDGDQDIFFSRQHRDTSMVDTILNGVDTTIQVIKVYMQIHILRNDYANIANNWVAVKVEPPAASNQSGIGTRIQVYAGGMKQTREVQAGIGHFANQQPYIQNISIGQANYIDSIVVRWQVPGFPTTKVVGPAINVVHIINQNGLNGFVKNWDDVAPIISVNEKSLNFGTINVDASKEMNFQVKNVGDAPLHINSIDFTEELKNQFTISSGQIGIDIAPNEIYTYTVKFAPTFRKEHTSYLKINSNAFNSKEKKLDFYAASYKAAPCLSVTPEISFDNIWVDSTKSQMLNLTNTGELDLTIDAINIKNDDKSVFSFEPGTFPIVIQPNSVQSITVKFNPKSKEIFTAQLSIISDSYKESESIVNLSGTCDGPNPLINISATLFIFNKIKVGEYKDKTFDISNDGTGILVVSDIKFGENPKNVLSLPNVSFPMYIKNSEPQSVTIRFAPVEPITLTTAFTIVSNSVEDPELVYQIITSGISSVFDGNFETLDAFVYPNPVNGNSLFVKFGEIITSGETEISIYNTTSQKVKEMKLLQGFSSDVFEMNIDDLCSGQYYVRISNGAKIAFLPFVIIR